jgi:hypothetical protein
MIDCVVLMIIADIVRSFEKKNRYTCYQTYSLWGHKQNTYSNISFKNFLKNGIF